MVERVVMQAPSELRIQDLPAEIEPGVPFLVRNADAGYGDSFAQEAFVLERVDTQDVGMVEKGECFEVNEWFVIRRVPR